MAENKFTQLCVWPGTTGTEDEQGQKDFVEFMKENLNARIEFCENVTTLPGQGGTGGRNDIFFKVHTDDIGHFAVPRLQMGIRWWEDVLGNGDGDIYPQEILDKYPKTW